MKYFGDVLQDFGNGARIDLRAKLASELLKAAVQGSSTATPADCCDMAEGLVAQFKDRGWIEPLPEDDQLDAATRAHLGRVARSQVIPPTLHEKIAQEEAPKIAQAVRQAMGNGNGFRQKKDR